MKINDNYLDLAVVFGRIVLFHYEIWGNSFYWTKGHRLAHSSVFQNKTDNVVNTQGQDTPHKVHCFFCQNFLVTPKWKGHYPCHNVSTDKQAELIIATKATTCGNVSFSGQPTFLALGRGGATKTHEFSEKFQRAYDPPSFSENLIAIFQFHVQKARFKCPKSAI